MSPTAKRVGMRLKALREAKGLSEAVLARKAKIAREYVNRLDAGRHDPSLSTLTALAKALKVALAELVK